MAFPSWLPLGLALRDYYDTGERTVLNVRLPSGTNTPYLAELFFREFEDFTVMDELACSMAKGRVLDAGAGVGCISIFLQEEMGMEVTAIDISRNCVAVMKEVGIRDAREGDVFELKEEQFDTIMLLMNGIGFVGNLEGLDRFFAHTKTILAPGGQLIFDTSDLKYAELDLEAEDLGGSEGEYYGEVLYELEYKGVKGKPYLWLYLDQETLKERAEAAGFRVEVIKEVEDGYYFVRLTLGE